MRKRPLFDVACENPTCTFVGKKRAGNFVRASFNKLKSGRKVQVLRCVCGMHRSLTPSMQKGLHHLPLRRAKQIAEQDPKNPEGPPIKVGIDAGDGLTLYHIARGLTINQVARLFVREHVPDPEHRNLDPDGTIEGMRPPSSVVGGWKNWLKLYPLLAERQRRVLGSLPKPRTRVDRTRLKMEQRKIMRRVGRAVQFPDEARRVLWPFVNRPKIAVITKTGYRRLCALLKKPFSAKAYDRLRCGIMQPLTDQEVDKNLFRRYRHLVL